MITPAQTPLETQSSIGRRVFVASQGIRVNHSGFARHA